MWIRANGSDDDTARKVSSSDNILKRLTPHSVRLCLSRHPVCRPPTFGYTHDQLTPNIGISIVFLAIHYGISRCLQPKRFSHHFKSTFGQQFDLTVLGTDMTDPTI